MEATGTIMGLRKKERKALFKGMRLSSMRASTMASTTLRGTAAAEKVRVFFAASLKAAFPISFLKLSIPTKTASAALESVRAYFTTTAKGTMKKRQTPRKLGQRKHRLRTRSFVFSILLVLERMIT